MVADAQEACGRKKDLSLQKITPVELSCQRRPGENTFQEDDNSDLGSSGYWINLRANYSVISLWHPALSAVAMSWKWVSGNPANQFPEW